MATANQNRLRGMHEAIVNGDLARVKLLLKAGVPADGRSPEVLRFKFACLAAMEGKMDILLALIDAGADAADPELLYYAAESGEASVDIVRHLLKVARPTSPDVLDAGLRFACTGGVIESVRLLIDAGANVNAADKEYGHLPLLNAIYGGHKEIVALLLSEGASTDVTVFDNPEDEYEQHKGKSALELATALGHARIAEMLRKVPGTSTAKKRKPAKQPVVLQYRCLHTRMIINGLPDLQLTLPDDIRALGEAHFKKHVKGTGDYLETDDGRFFIRCAMYHPIIDRSEQFGYGIWVEISAQDFRTYKKNFKLKKMRKLGPFDGQFANQIPDMPSTIGLRCRVHLSDEGLRPVVEILAAKHPLAREQAKGIDLKRAIALAQLMPDAELMLGGTASS